MKPNMKHNIRTCTAALMMVLGAAAFTSSHALEQEKLDSLTVHQLPQLGHGLLELERPNRAEELDRWQLWVRQTVEFQRGQGLWPNLIVGYQHLPDDTPDELRNWFRLQVIDSYLALGDGVQARALILPLLWQEAPDADAVESLRRSIVYSYIVDGLAEDAQSAVLRFDQDYPESANDGAWAALKARALLSAGRSSEAADLVAYASDAPGRAAYLLAKFAALEMGSPLLLNDALSLLDNNALTPELKQALYQGALANAALLLEHSDRIQMLERLLLMPVAGVDLADAVEALWNGYEQYGAELANKSQLLQGNFEPWFDKAAQLGGTTPFQGRAIYAWLAINGEPESRERAHALLVSSLDHGVLNSLYLSSQRYALPENIPLVIVLKLVDAALDDAAIKRAVQLINLAEGRYDPQAVDWQLRRARVQILTGMTRYGAGQLQQLTSGVTMTRDQMNYFIATVLDLKAMGAVSASFELLQAMLDYVPEVALHRQLLYWMAESLMGQRRFVEAADHYLRSAYLISDDAKDSWALEARYRAVRALVSASYLRDAERVLQALINDSDDLSRRTLLENTLRNVHRMARAEQVPDGAAR